VSNPSSFNITDNDETLDIKSLSDDAIVSKNDLRTEGNAQVNWNNLINVPSFVTEINYTIPTIFV
jgi:hypothetical protein